MNDVPEYVFFDLDQTVVPWDTQLLFRNHVLQEEGWRRLLTFVFLAFVPFFKLLGAGQMKRVFHCYLWGMKKERLDELAESFVEKWLPLISYPEIVAEIERHRAAGRILVLSSASPEIWVAKIGEKLGFDHALGTLVEWGETVAFFPELMGKNHKGEEKVRRLAGLGITHGVAGYSDSRADLPMLELCDEKILVNPLSGMRATGEKRAWRLMEPARPWSGRISFGWGCVRQLWGFFKITSSK